ncbi:MAG: TonB-dependent receptor [Deltaproteobacteria bacterium]|jgi:hemoglobin/transferrin/lactoferrin receptor protein|nr:TonB-dependent receptor [Deltaproteobacteria bacterium]
MKTAGYKWPKMSFYLISCFVLLVWAILAGPIVAQEDELDEDQPIRVRRIDVTANRTVRDISELSQTVNVITAEEIARMPATSITDILTRVPGLDVSMDINDNSPEVGMSGISLRGETTGRTLILVNGVKTVDREKGNSNVYITPDQIERIEVIKGPASVLYGAEAIGGVVNIITKRGGDKPIGFSLGTIFDTSTDGIDGNAAVFGRLANGFNYRLSGDATNVHDRKVPKGTVDANGAPLKRAFGSSYQKRYFSGQIGYDWDDYSLTLQADHFETVSHTTVSLNDTLVSSGNGYTAGKTESYAPKNDRDTILTTFVADNLSSYFRKLTATLSYQLVDVKRQTFGWQIPTVQPNNAQDAYEVDTNSTSKQYQLAGSVQTEWLLGKHYLILGFEFYRDEVKLGQNGKQTTASNPQQMALLGTYTRSTANVEMQEYSLFAQDEWSFAQDWRLVMGLRQTWNSGEMTDKSGPYYLGLLANERKYSDLVGSLGLVYAVSENLALRTQWSQGVRYPTVQQLYTGRGTNSVPNPDLMPERSISYEVGARYSSPSLNLDLSVYHTRARNFIEEDRTVDPVTNVRIGSGQFENIGWARTIGAELTASYTFQDLGLTPYADVVWMHRKQTKTRDFLFATSKTRNPPFVGRLGLRYERDLSFLSSSFYGDVFMNWAAPTTDEASGRGGNTYYPGWQCLNLNLGLMGGEERHFNVSLSLNNIFDAKYNPARSGNRSNGGRSSNLSAAARHAVIGLTYQY